MQTRRGVLSAGFATAAALAIGLPGCERKSSGAAPSLEVLVPSGPGGGWDQTARSMERALRASGIVEGYRVEHVPGGGGAVGLARFLADPGRTDALLVSGMVMIGALITNRSPVGLADATPIARLTGEYEVIAVHPDSPVASMGELVEQLQRDPGSVSWAGGAAGGTDHMLVAMIAQAAGVAFADLAYLAYAGGGLAQATLLGNQVTCGVSGYGELAEQIGAGNLRALAISAPQPVPGIEAPTLRQSGLDLDLVNWRGVFGAPGIDIAERDALVELIGRMVATPAWRAELDTHRWTDLLLAGDRFGDYLQTETTRITDLLTRVGLVAR